MVGMHLQCILVSNVRVQLLPIHSLYNSISFSNHFRKPYSEDMSFTVSMVGNVNNIWRNTLSSRSSLKRNRRMVVVKATEEDMDPDMFINPEMKKDRDQVVNLKIKKDEDEVAEFVALPKLSKNTTAYCRCWRSGIFPLCDASHVKHNRETGDNVGPVLLMK